MLGTGGSHKWVTQVFTEGSILAGEWPHLAKDASDPCPHYQNHNDWFPRVWWKPNRQACVSPSYTELEIKVLIGRRNPYL